MSGVPKANYGRGTCPDCNRPVLLSKEGRLKKHGGWVTNNKWEPVCPGSSKEPKPKPHVNPVADAWNRGENKYRVEVLGQAPLPLP